MKNQLEIDSRLSSAYLEVFKELSNKESYRTYSVAEFYCDQFGKPDENRINVIVRIDVDNAFHLSVPLAEAMTKYRVHSSHYFLTHPDRYYKIWGSGIPAKVAQLGHEVGLHSDHNFDQLTRGTDGLQELKKDVEMLSIETGKPVRGMVCHGSPEIDKLGTTNWELTKNSLSNDLGLEYHDGLKSCYIEPGSPSWKPRCDIRLTDFLGYPYSWGWNYYPFYPISVLRAAKPGQIVHMSFHTKNAFKYWLGWTDKYGEVKRNQESKFSFYKKAIPIRIRFRWFDGRGLKNIIFMQTSRVISNFLAKYVGRLWPTPTTPEKDTSWESGRKEIYNLGISYWRKELERFNILAPQGTVIEVGSGNGQWLLAFAEDAAKVIGIEPGREIREFAQEKVSEFPDREGKIEIMDGGAENIPLEDEIADVVFCSGVFMFTAQTRALKEMCRILKPNGRICINVNGLGYFLMYILDGFRYKSPEKMRYGLTGLIATCLKWFLRKDVSWQTAVSIREMKQRLLENNLTLESSNTWLSGTANFPQKHLGFVTNYSFTARKTI